MEMKDSSGVPDDFLEQVKQALSHLYDFPFLQNFELAQQMFGKFDQGESVGLSFRRTLIECIEALNPGENLLYRSPDGNIYNLLRYYYIDRMTLNEAQIELGISERQSYRVLKRGQISVAELLWSKFSDTTLLQEDESHPIQQELSRLQRNIQDFDLGKLVSLAQLSVESLAELYDKQVTITQHDTPIMVTSSFPIAQQLLIHILSFSIKHIPSNHIEVILEKVEDTTFLHLQYRSYLADLLNTLEQTAIPELARQLGWEISHTLQDAELGVISLQIRAGEFTILVIDDNEELSELINRFLANKPYRVIFSTSGEHGIQRAQDANPDIVVLDIMMPAMNGWEILQRLRTNPVTEDIPVIICSVINDPELAYSLNASQVLAKPINQEKLITALDKIISEQTNIL